MLNDILNIANQYALGLQQVQDRKVQWVKKQLELKAQLTEIAEYLNSNATYKPGYFVDSLHAFNEAINGTCAEMQSLVFRSGDMPMQVSFSNDKGEKKDFVERGFQITFTPTVTGEILVYLVPHYSELNTAPPQPISMAVFTVPSYILPDQVEALVSNAMELAFHTSFTGIAEVEETAEKQAQAQALNIPHHNPIGFKRYATTEKAN